MSEKARIVGSASGALGLGAFAAAVGACCGMPWAVALMGVSGAVALARLAFLLPYAIVGAVALLGVAFWWAYRPVPACNEGTCNPATRRPLRRIVWTSAVLVVVLATVALSSGCTRGQSPVGVSVPYTRLDDDASQLRADFNRKAGSVRLLFVVDPICPTCLRGLADMNRDLLGSTADPRLQTFVVHEPVLGLARYAPWLRVSGGEDVPKAAQLLQNPNVRHYWNPTGAFGRLLSRAVGLKNGDRQVYAWDVWLVYGPEARWVGTDPPRPRLLMHQLGALRGGMFPHLDSHVFAQQVQTLLAEQANR